MERDAHLQSLFYLSSRVTSKGALSPGSLHRAPDTEIPHLKPLSAISQSTRYTSPLQVAQLSPHEERCLSPEPSFHNPGYPVRSPPSRPSTVSLVRGRSPIPRTSFISQRSRYTDPPPQVPNMERRPSQNLLPCINPWHMNPLPGFPARPPMERGAHIQSLLLHLQVPLTELP
jgi:hypothetical protein